MRRLYMIEVHVKAPGDEHQDIVSALQHWGMKLTAPHNEGRPFGSYEDGYLIYEGEIALSEKKCEHDMHMELKEILPAFSLITKWNCIEHFEWDEIIDDEECDD